MTKPPTSGRMDFPLDLPEEEPAAPPVAAVEPEKKTTKKPGKPYRASAEHRKSYYKGTTLYLTKDLYFRFRTCLLMEEILGQEALEGMVKKWVNQVEKKHAKREAGDGTSEAVEVE